MGVWSTFYETRCSIVTGKYCITKYVPEPSEVITVTLFFAAAANVVSRSARIIVRFHSVKLALAQLYYCNTA